MGMRHLRAVPHGAENYCENPAGAPVPAGGAGLGMDGGMAELMLVPDARHLLPLPEGLHPVTAAPLALDATLYRIERVLWSSSVDQLDVTIAELDGLPADAARCPIAAERPLLNVEPPPRTYVIGHPGGVSG